ncbi:MotA/TolQ/ExbB proton channel family protein [Diaphorobacter caeni]|uniref:MotA/TolQ/ExbB proton channel family protein n=1 Tax=Diaphorobacter caeni TaxID=2784387 RepID=UPI001890818D|nr:MotA/TolQ/ExbB proton channel family protein [Diaphorobacter caeni]MBF5004511.1 MotA/TolQ/ExbB proton channel family protein [Diaphorobacter caeni]
MNSNHFIGHFLAQTDTVGLVLALILLAMSLASWTYIVGKSLQLWSDFRRGNASEAAFWSAPSIAAVTHRFTQSAPRDPMARLASDALRAQGRVQGLSAHTLAQAGTPAEWLTRQLRRSIDHETTRLEGGLTLLSSVAAVAPFVGLFGTVWGVYHALSAIGGGAGASLEQIAGPVGEALVMTGFGLAVAIPAVLAYNAFSRANRVLLNRLDGHAHDLLHVLTTGLPVQTAAGGV